MKGEGKVVFEVAPEGVDEETLALELETRLGVVEGRRAARRVTFYDTFDWRLWRAKRRLEAVRGGDRARATLILSDPGGTPLRRLPSAPAPSFASVLPEGPLRAILEPLTAGRRLLPRAELRCRRRVWRLVDGQGKTLLRVFLDRCEVSSPGRPDSLPLPALLRLEPVRGYTEARRRALAELKRIPGLERREGDELTSVLAVLGRRPGDYSSKIDLHLEPETRADTAMKQVHRALLDAVRSNEDGTRRDLDPEFLHDLRVAVRRARTVLGQVKEVFPEQVVERFRRELAWLGQVTGPTRDLDVYRLKLQGYRRELAGAASDLDGLGEYLERHRSEEQARLAKVLVGARYQRLVNAWQSFVDRPVPAHSGLAHAERPIVEVAAGRIHKVWKRVVARGRAIDAASPAEELHRLRIDCKKLRYLLEIFRSLFAADEVAALVRSLKQLQDCLGDYNDYEVQQEMLGVFARGMAEEGSAPVPTLLAMGRLVERLSQAQAAERERFEKRFRRFADEANHRRFKELFGAKAVARRLEVPGSGG